MTLARLSKAAGLALVVALALPALGLGQSGEGRVTLKDAPDTAFPDRVYQLQLPNTEHALRRGRDNPGERRASVGSDRRRGTELDERRHPAHRRVAQHEGRADRAGDGRRPGIHEGAARGDARRRGRVQPRAARADRLHHRLRCPQRGRRHHPGGRPRHGDLRLADPRVRDGDRPGPEARHRGAVVRRERKFERGGRGRRARGPRSGEHARHRGRVPVDPLQPRAAERHSRRAPAGHSSRRRRPRSSFPRSSRSGSGSRTSTSSRTGRCSRRTRRPR